MAKTAKHEKDLKALEREFKTWRRKRRRGSRIPETLWARAVSVAAIHGQWKTSRRLRLNYYDLKKRCEARPAGAGVGMAGASKGTATLASPVAEFVELPLVVERNPECMLEFEDERGTLRVGLRGAGVQQLETATRLLWELSR